MRKYTFFFSNIFATRALQTGESDVEVGPLRGAGGMDGEPQGKKRAREVLDPQGGIATQNEGDCDNDLGDVFAMISDTKQEVGLRQQALDQFRQQKKYAPLEPTIPNVCGKVTHSDGTRAFVVSDAGRRAFFSVHEYPEFNQGSSIIFDLKHVTRDGGGKRYKYQALNIKRLSLSDQKRIAFEKYHFNTDMFTSKMDQFRSVLARDDVRIEKIEPKIRKCHEFIRVIQGAVGLENLAEMCESEIHDVFRLLDKAKQGIMRPEKRSKIEPQTFDLYQSIVNKRRKTYEDREDSDQKKPVQRRGKEVHREKSLTRDDDRNRDEEQDKQRREESIDFFNRKILTYRTDLARPSLDVCRLEARMWTLQNRLLEMEDLLSPKENQQYTADLEDLFRTLRNKKRENKQQYKDQDLRLLLKNRKESSSATRDRDQDELPRAEQRREDLCREEYLSERGERKDRYRDEPSRGHHSSKYCDDFKCEKDRERPRRKDVVRREDDRRNHASRDFELPPGWHATWDKSSNEYYFWNPETGQCEWDSPSIHSKSARDDGLHSREHREDAQHADRDTSHDARSDDAEPRYRSLESVQPWEYDYV